MLGAEFACPPLAGASGDGSSGAAAAQHLPAVHYRPPESRRGPHWRPARPAARYTNQRCKPTLHPVVTQYVHMSVCACTCAHTQIQKRVCILCMWIICVYAYVILLNGMIYGGLLQHQEGLQRLNNMLHACRIGGMPTPAFCGHANPPSPGTLFKVS